MGEADGVSVEAAKWQWALQQLGFSVFTVAGDGIADVIVPGLAMDATAPPDRAQLASVLDPADVVIVENLCSLPLNPAAGEAVAAVLHGRPAVLHHHDLPWQRERFAGAPPPPDDPRWVHVTINDLSRRQLAAHGLANTVTVRNAFDLDAFGTGDRDATRRALEVATHDTLALQPTRAIARKNVPAAVALAEELGAVYWLLGPAEDGYEGELARTLGAANVRVIHQPGRWSAAEAYAACDVVLLPSTWEGFGNATVESAVHRKPLVIGDYPVAKELMAFGYRWFSTNDVPAIRAFLDAPDLALLDHNAAVARAHFSLADLPHRLAPVLERVL